MEAGDGPELIEDLRACENAEVLRERVLHRLGIWMDSLRERKEHSRSHVVQRAILFVTQRFKEEISMEQTAEYVNLSPYYFSKLFKLQTGENFSDYLTRLRIEESKRLIAQRSLSLKEICYEVGYKDPNYFSRVFKKAVGISPSEYRQQIETE